MTIFDGDIKRDSKNNQQLKTMYTFFGGVCTYQYQHYEIVLGNFLCLRILPDCLVCSIHILYGEGLQSRNSRAGTCRK